MHLVIVESPAKAKTIERYLGGDYRVLASYGHVRDLPPKDGSVRPDEDFAMDWAVDDRGDKRIKEIARELKGADQLYLATDPDREGEAISWHIIEELNRRRVLNGKPVKRVVFNEITKRAVQDAFKHPRDLDRPLVEAYLARRALDYLVGFTLSPVLWRKLPGSRSAGRVQSVALRLICEREAEIEAFRAQEYWTVTATLDALETTAFDARLTHLRGDKLDKFDLNTEAKAQEAVALLEGAGRFTVARVETKRSKRHPQPPFTTSTLQQEASRKLGFGATRTMRVAQKLYEGIDLGGETVGLITYMRTDGVGMSNEAITAARELISGSYGDPYLPDQARVYKTKAKNAQEAHEAVRPTDLRRLPKEIRGRLGEDEARLYDLIWKRALASQMESAEFDQMTADIDVDGSTARLRATGSVQVFDGFLTLYQEGRDDPEDEDGEGKRLPPLSEGQDLNRKAVTPQQHFTQPPPRFSEASLVKRMEELGIGRPSTYASILQVLQDRDYVRLEKKRFLPEDRGRIVTAFLTAFFRRYVEYDFTASLEEDLDRISAGDSRYKEVLYRFWEAFNQAIEDTKELRITNVIDALDEDLGPHFFPADPENPERNPRLCPACGTGRLGLRLGKTGGFIGCSNYPDCRFTRPLAVQAEEGSGGATPGEAGPKSLGEDPETGQDVSLRKGPYGHYVQLGEQGEDKSVKPKRTSLPKGLALDDVDLKVALGLLALPRSLGSHEGEEITAGIGRYGPYVRKANTYKSIPPDEDVLVIGLNRAVDLLAQAKGGGAAALKTLGDHPSDGKPVTLHEGRYGPYVKHGRLNASLPKDLGVDEIDLSGAVDLLAKQAEKKGGKKSPAKKTAAKKTTTKKAPTKKTPAKKAAAKKPAAKAKKAAEA
ncbi:type I DNA topoisomerase [Algihabitans sp.]|uniref:type I DNA topoisomerase n=1 Tax=Algihabitans sp. TaxID=2821514 RepID=UPI003BA8C692